MTKSETAVEFSANYQDQKPLNKLVPRNKYLFLGTVVILSMVHPTVLGYDALMAGSILNLKSYTSYFNLTPATIGLNNAGLWIGEILANLTVNQFLTDRLGRKKSIFTGSVVVLVGVVLQSAAQDIAMFIVGRIIIGFGGIMTNVSAIVLVAEVCPVDRRGIFMGIAFSSFLVGGLLASGITYALRDAPGDWNWRSPGIFMAAPAAVALTNLIFVPESPRWLLARGKARQAHDLLMIINDNDQDKTIRIMEDFEAENRDRLMKRNYHPWAELFKSRINLHRVLIVLVQALIVEMSGMSVGTYYLAILLEEAGISSSKARLEVNMAMSAWQLACALTGAFFIDKIGRRRQAFISMCGMVTLFLILGGLVKLYGSGADKSGAYGTISVIFLFCGCYAFTFTPMTSIYASELFQFELRSAGTSVFQLFNSSFGLVSAFVLPIGMSNIGWKYYIVNGAYDIVFLPLIYYVWVETKGVDLEYVDQVFENHPFHRGHFPHNTPSDEDSGSVSQNNIVISVKS